MKTNFESGFAVTSSQESTRPIVFTDIQRRRAKSGLKDQIIDALTSETTSFPSELLWNDKGLAKFDAIRVARSMDYYPSRKEAEIINEHADDIIQSIPKDATVLELGSGNPQKTIRILSALQRQGKSITYYALDLCPAGLQSSLHELAKKIPPNSGIRCHGLLGTYEDCNSWLTQKFEHLETPVVVLWLGNSIGNFGFLEASAFLAEFVSRNAGLRLQFVIGVDGCRDIRQIEKCYNTKNPLTLDFLMNGLEQANELLQAPVFNKEDWSCVGSYDKKEHVWKDYYVAQRCIELSIGGSVVQIVKGQRILAISSAKWSEFDVAEISREASLKVSKIWRDSDRIYVVYLLCQNKDYVESRDISSASKFAEDAAVRPINGTFSEKSPTNDPTPISDSDLKLLKQWNGGVPCLESCCVHDMIGRQTTLQPDAVAIDSFDGQLTYQILDELSSLLAQHLGFLGVGLEEIVPLCFEKSKWAVVSMLAVMKAGAAFAFVEPSHPVDRILNVLQDTEAKVILTSPSVSCLFTTSSLMVRHIVEITQKSIDGIDIASCSVLPVVQPHNAAVVLFTSGSTGKPKGIVQEHSTAAFIAQTCARAFGIQPGSRVFQWAAYCFDMSVIDILMGLIGGACVCIPSEEMRLNSLANAMRDMRVNCAALTPSVAKVLKSTYLPDLRTLIFGGEAVSREHLEGWQEHIRVINGYGPGEASVCIAGEANPDCPGKIGTAIGSVSWIVQPSDHRILAPIGTVGELLIEGPLLARSYLNDPEKTAAGFVEDPPWLGHFRGKGERPRRLYKTGDLARYSHDGTIDFIGRKDNQLKLRGQRIEPGDVEANVRRCLPFEASVAVDIMVPSGTSMTAQLVAFVGLDTEEGDLNDDRPLTAVATIQREKVLPYLLGLGQRLSKSLPAYMIPAYAILMRKLPLTLSGKLDRKLLKRMGSSLAPDELLRLKTLTRQESNGNGPGELNEMQDEMQARIADPLTFSGKLDRKLPKHMGSSLAPDELLRLNTLTHQEANGNGPDELDGMQVRMADLWLDILGIHPRTLSSDDNFFILGGDSVKAMQLVAIAATAGISLTTARIFRSPTLAGLSLAAVEASKVHRFPGPCPSQTQNGSAHSIPSAGSVQYSGVQPFWPRNIDGIQPIVVEEMYCPGLNAKQVEIEKIVEAPDLQAYMVACGSLKTHGYVNYFAFDISGPIDIKRLESSCHLLVAQHSILRTVFALHAGRIQQVVLSNYRAEFSRLSSQEEKTKILENLCSMDQFCDSHLGDDIVRFLLVERNVNNNLLIMRISHAQFDGTSLHIIYEDLQRLYIYNGGTLPPTPQYADWARASKNANSAVAENYWRKFLQGSSMTSILVHSKTSYKYVINSRAILTTSCNSVQAEGITVATLVKAAWALVLAELSSTTDVVFGNAVTGRNLPLTAVDRIVGDCNNAVLLRVRIDSVPTVLSLLHQIQDQLVASMPYETIGCRQLVEKCTDWPRWTRYSTSVNHQNYTDAGLETFRLGEAQCRVSYRDLESDRRDIQIYSYPPTRDGTIMLEMAYCDLALGKEVVEGMLQRLGETVQRFSSDVHAPVVVSANLPVPPRLKIPMAIAAIDEKQEDGSEPRLCTFRYSVLDPEALVERVWLKFAALFQLDPARTHGSPGEDAPFYAIGGDLVYAAQLSAWYHGEGVTFSMEGLLEHPTKRLQKEALGRFSGPFRSVGTVADRMAQSAE